MNRFFTFIISLIVLFSCKKESTSNCTTTIASKPNILLIIADDFGLDACPGYTIGSTKPNMPNLQKMINSGVRYNNFWTYPVCTPTRSSIMTGKYGFRTNMLNVGDVLSTSETSLQSYIGNSYANAVIGKWHLSTNANHPNNMGIDYYAGLLSGATPSYNNWRFTNNGSSSTDTNYITKKITDLAINWVDNQSKPWFLWLAYTAPHTPFHLPPNHMHSQGVLPTDSASIAANPLPYFMAMAESMDYEIGRLLDSMSQEEKDNTVIIFIGDNGTSGEVIQQYNTRRGKGSVYQGGINCPMIVSGTGISRFNETDDAFVGTVDLFATIADIAGTGTTELHDSKSFRRTFSETGYTMKNYLYSEIGNTTSTDYTIRNATHKYIMFDDGSEALYNLGANPFENPNLMAPMRLPLSPADSTIKAELEDEILRIKM